MITPVECARLEILVNNAPVHLRVHGEGVPILMVHGGGPGTTGDTWLPCMDLLAGRFRCFAPDLPGFGASPARETGVDIASLARVVQDLARTLCLDGFVLVGHSMGAAVAAQVAKACGPSLRHLVLVAPGGTHFGITGYRSEGIHRIARFTDEPVEARMQELVQVLCSREILRPTQVAQRMRWIGQPGVLETQRRLLAGRGEQGRAHSIVEGAFECPVTLVWAEEEAFNPATLGPRILERLPGGTRYVTVERAGHNIQEDQPATLARLLVEIAGGSKHGVTA